MPYVEKLAKHFTKLAQQILRKLLKRCFFLDKSANLQLKLKIWCKNPFNLGKFGRFGPRSNTFPRSNTLEETLDLDIDITKFVSVLSNKKPHYEKITIISVKLVLD